LIHKFFGFIIISELHKLLHRTQNKAFNCEECDQQFLTNKLMLNHIKETHDLFDESTQMFKCNYNGCKLQFDRYSKLTAHRKRHFGEKTFKCSDQYPDCKSIFFTKGELNNHRMYSHNVEKSFVCDYEGCGEQFMKRKDFGSN
jgi:uncharacterized Zn-finger protein